MRYIRNISLKAMCLDSVIEHLDIYIYHKHRIPQRHFDFLHLVYSKEIFRKYTFARSRTEERLLWFLGSFNKNVSLPHITPNIVERLQAIGSVITSLTLQETIATEEMLNSVICCVPNLSYLDLSRSNCSDNTLLCIQKMCPNLITLNLQGCNVTDDGMVNLCGNSLSLKNLNILCTDVDHIGVHDILVGMPSLQRLSYDNMGDSFHYIFESDACSPNQNNLTFNLTELIYESTEMSLNPKRVIWTWLVLCPNVEKVYILFPVKEDVLQMCSRFLCLKEFKYKRKNRYNRCIDTPDPLASLISKSNNLTTLKLSYVKIQCVTLINCFKNLKNLYMKGVTFADFNEDDIISKNTNLDRLTIRNICFDSMHNYKSIASLLSLSKNVTELIISNIVSFPSDIIDIIFNSMKSLIFIEFSFIGTKLPLFKFFEIPTVQRVYVDGCIEPCFKPIHIATDSNSLAWRVMSDIDEDDDYDMKSDYDYEDEPFYESDYD